MASAQSNPSQLEISWDASTRPPPPPDLAAELAAFDAFGTATLVEPFPDPAEDLPVYRNEFWTAKQRAAHPLHEVSYRACFKPQLPRFFIERLTRPGDVVYDPFMGRGTTLLEAALLGRFAAGCDINPLSRHLLAPRLAPPALGAIARRLEAIDWTAAAGDVPEGIEVFYHPATLTALRALRAYLLAREASGEADAVDGWIRMVATNRLTGHSPGFFSVYTLPPNQATSVKAQIRINERRGQAPTPRDVAALILRKSSSLLGRLTAADRTRLTAAHDHARLITGSCDATPDLADQSVHLVVTSPPFLDVVNYRQDNWLRCWFNGIDAAAVPIWQLGNPTLWQSRMQAVFTELRRVLVEGGHVAFEVGEVRRGTLALESLVVPAARAAGLDPVLMLINQQDFTKTAHCWGVDNRSKGTNTNRIVLLRK